MRRIKPQFLTIKEIRQIMLEGSDMPTAIFSAQKNEYLVKPRGTIFGKSKTKRNARAK